MDNSTDGFASSTPSVKTATVGHGSHIHIGPLLFALWLLNFFTVDLRHGANDAGLSDLAFYFIMAAIYLLAAFLPPARSIRKFLVIYALVYVPSSWMVWHWILRRT